METSWRHNHTLMTVVAVHERTLAATLTMQPPIVARGYHLRTVAVLAIAVVGFEVVGCDDKRYVE